MNLWRALLPLLTCAALAGASGFSAAPGAPLTPELAERLFRAAQDLERGGQAEPARQAYRQLLEQDPAGARVPDVLLALARLDWGVSNPDDLGSTAADAGKLGEAKGLLETIAKDHPGSPAAGEALWRLALLFLEPAGSSWNPEQALAALTTLLRVHPEAPQAPQALALAATLQVAAGRLPQARALAFRLLAEWPGEPSTARGWLALAAADARDNDNEAALAEAGRARAAAAGRDEPTARASLALATLVDRLAFSAARGARPYEIGRAVALTGGKVTDLVAAPDGALWAAIPSDRIVVSLPRTGGAPTTQPAPGVKAVAVDRWGRLWTGGGAVVTAPPGTGALTLPERTDVVALAPAGARAVWIADERERKVLRVEAGRGVTTTARLPERANPVAIAPDGAGGAWVLDARNGKLIDIGEQGDVKVSVSLSDAAPDPVDVGSDSLGDAYVLDGSAPALLVFSPAGKLVLRQPLLRQGDQGFSRAAVLAVDPSGAVAVYDGRRKRAVWMQ